MSRIDALENLRHSFRPAFIATLFVGESAPVGGTFFYAADAQLYRTMRSAFAFDETDFLAAFKARGWFLDDLVLVPVNHRTQAERRKLHRQWTASLARRIETYRPRAVVSLLLSIEEAVAEAVARAGIAGLTHYALPYPGNRQQLRFKRELARILDELPAL
jgi:hypothetical protein